MKVTIGKGGATLHREQGGKRIGKESTVVFHMRNLLNAQGYNFVRIRPDKYGLTSCPSGLADWKRGIILWHERYAIEDAAEEFNKFPKSHVWGGEPGELGSVFFQRVDEEISNRRLGDKALLKSGVSTVTLETLAADFDEAEGDADMDMIADYLDEPEVAELLKEPCA